MKFLLLIFTVSSAFSSVCGTGEPGVLDRLASLSDSDVSLEQVIQQTKKVLMVKKNSQATSELERELAVLEKNINSDPLRRYYIKEEIKKNKKMNELKEIEKIKSKEPQLLEKIASQPIGKSTEPIQTVDEKSNVKLPLSVIKKMQKEGVNTIEIMTTELKIGDAYNIWLPGGHYSPAKIISSDMDKREWVVVEYWDGEKLVKASKPVSHLVITPSQKKELSTYQKTIGPELIENILLNTKNIKAKKKVSAFIDNSLEVPGTKEIKIELEQIYNKEGISGMASQKYLSLQDELKKIEAPYSPLSKDEIDSIFKPLTVLQDKAKHGVLDIQLINTAKSVISSKKKLYAKDKGWRALVVAAQDAPKKIKAKRRHEIVRDLLAQGKSRSFRYFSYRYSDNEILEVINKKPLNYNIDDLLNILKQHPEELSKEDIGQIRAFSIRAKKLSESLSSNQVFIYFQRRAKLYLEYLNS